MAGAYCNAMHNNDLECTVAITGNVGRPNSHLPHRSLVEPDETN